MALTLEVKTDRSIGLDEYVAYVSKEVDFRDLASTIASAPMLLALANNRQFLAAELNQRLMSWKTFQADNVFTAQTLVLARGRGFVVRANIWAPPPKGEHSEHYERLYQYKIPHDHNFDFLTVGYMGPGYETLIYEYDGKGVTGLPGEHVPMRFLERTTLPVGKVMMYRASTDIHQQEHAPAFSVSLNLLFAPKEAMVAEQYFFDLDKQCITQNVESSTSSRLFFCRLARHLGNASSIAALEALAKTHAVPRVRAECFTAIAALDGGAREQVWKAALEDRHPYVRSVAARNIEGR